MNRIFLLVAAVLLMNTAIAQDNPEDYEQILPEAAQKCVMPRSPDSIPDDALYEDLVNAKKQIAEFQGKIEEYRQCLSAAESNEDNTPGNNAAIVASYNYTVETEERVAERFNAAVRSFKERKAAAEG